MPSVDLSTKTITRLQKHAVPLIDTFDTIIGKLLDAYEAKPKAGVVATQGQSNIQVFDPAAPPNLLHATVKFVKFCGKVLQPDETYWNPLMHVVIRMAAKTGVPLEDLSNDVLVNNVVGRKEVDGYKFLPDVGLSVQGQDANGAWRAIYHLANKFKFPLEVTFMWKHNSKATFPGVMGSFTV